MDAVNPPVKKPNRSYLWVLGPSLILALGCALIPLFTLQASGAPAWVALVAVGSFFPLLPLVWHLLAERGAGKPAGGRVVTRFALRSLAVGLLVLAVSIANLGATRVSQGFLALFGQDGQAQELTPDAEPSPAPEVEKRSPKPVVRSVLEPFIPGEATSVMVTSDPAFIERLLAGVQTENGDSMRALRRCEIGVDKGHILMAGRDPENRLYIIRAPGITDPRNLYCLAGFLGSERVRLTFTREKPPIQFQLSGLVPRRLEFKALDEQTLLAVDGDWAQALESRLFDGEVATGPLANVLAKVDRGASAWAAALLSTDVGVWKVAFDARFDDDQIRLRGTSISPGGKDAQAFVESTVPVAFAHALPPSAFEQGLRGLVAMLASVPAAMLPAAPGVDAGAPAQAAAPAQKPQP